MLLSDAMGYVRSCYRVAVSEDELKRCTRRKSDLQCPPLLFALKDACFLTIHTKETMGLGVVDSLEFGFHSVASCVKNVLKDSTKCSI